MYTYVCGLDTSAMTLDGEHTVLDKIWGLFGQSISSSYHMPIPWKRGYKSRSENMDLLEDKRKKSVFSLVQTIA